MTDEPVTSITSSGPWKSAGTVVAWLVGSASLTMLGLLFGRPDLVVLAVPITIALVWGLMTRPTDASTVAVTVPKRRDDGRIATGVILTPAAGSQVALLRAAAAEHRPVDVLIASHRPRRLQATVSGVRTGRRGVLTIAHQEASDGRFVRSEPRQVGPVRITVLPTGHRLGALPLPPRLQGMTGSHGSRRVGDGGDLHDVALFTPGAKLRRIDWRASLRASARHGIPAGSQGAAVTDLYVRRTLATADALVMVVLDSRDEVGPDPHTWSGTGVLHPDEPTSLDIARHAAGSVATRFLETGDRVGLVDLAGWRAPLRPAGGRRHLHRLLLAMAEATPAGDAQPVVRPPLIPAGALVVVVSTFLDDEASTVASQWVRHGHRVIAVDTLPQIEDDHLDHASRNALRILMLQRQTRVRHMVRTGVEFASWQPTNQDMTGLSAALAVAAVRRPRR